MADRVFHYLFSLAKKHAKLIRTHSNKLSLFLSRTQAELYMYSYIVGALFTLSVWLCGCICSAGCWFSLSLSRADETFCSRIDTWKSSRCRCSLSSSLVLPSDLALPQLSCSLPVLYVWKYIFVVVTDILCDQIYTLHNTYIKLSVKPNAFKFCNIIYVM